MFLVFLLFVLQIIDMNRKAFISPVFFPLIYFHTSPCFRVSLRLSPLFFVCLSGLRSRCPPAPSLGAGMTSSHRCLVLRVPIHHPDHHRRHQQHHLRTHTGTHTHTDCMQIKGEVRKWTPTPPLVPQDCKLKGKKGVNHRATHVGGEREDPAGLGRNPWPVHFQQYISINHCREMWWVRLHAPEGKTTTT